MATNIPESVSPRVRMAAALYASGAVPTKKAASEAAGLHPHYLTHITQKVGSEKVRQLIDDIGERITDESVEASVILRTLGRQAVKRIHQLMDSDNENIALKAAIDLADRSNETSKTQKVQVDGFSLGDEDAKLLAAALVRSAQAEAGHGKVISGDYVRVDLNLLEEQKEEEPAANAQEALPMPEGQALTQADAGEATGEVT
jgi:hypothetical protein